MPALGHFDRPIRRLGLPMSAVTPIATRILPRRDWSLSARTADSHRSKAVPLFDHLVGGRKQDGGATVRPRIFPAHANPGDPTG